MGLLSLTILQAKLCEVAGALCEMAGGGGGRRVNFS